MKNLAGLLLLMALIPPVSAAERTVTLSVPGMTCGTCPLTVKTALMRLDGVSKVDVNYDTRLAIVTFDDAKLRIEQLTQATAEAGYPSTTKVKPQ
ncbi:MAG: mercury resistance system periplasmic binding protein MerP [Pseudomonadota bacterium]